MDAAGARRRRGPAAGRAARRDGPPARLPAPDPLDLARACRCSRRCTSGCRSSALGTTEAFEAVPPRGGRRLHPLDVLARTRCGGWSTTRTRPRERGAGRPRGGARALRPRAVPGRLGRAAACERRWPHEDRDGLRARQPAGRARRRRRGRAERPRRRAGARARPARRRGRRPHPPRRPDAARAACSSRPGVEVDHVDAGPPTRDPQGRAAAAHARVRRTTCASSGATSRPTSCTRTSGCPAWPRSTRRAASASRSCTPSTRSARSSAATRATATRARRGGSRSSARSRRSVDRIVATCTDEVFELLRMGADRRRITVVPCGVDLERFGPTGRAEPRGAGRARLVAACRLVERKGSATPSTRARRRARRRAARRGRADAGALDADPEAQRLRALAERLGVGDRLVLRGRVGRDGDAGAAALGRRRRLRALVRAVRDRAAGGDGLRRPGRRDRGRRADRHGRARRHRPARPAARPGGARARRCARCSRDPARRAALGAAGARRVRASATASTASRARRATSTPSVRARRAPARGECRSRPRVGRASPPAAGRQRAPRRADGAARGALRRDATGSSAGARELARVLGGGGRLLAAGNGGSARQAQHLTAELVGRYRDDRRAVHRDRAVRRDLGADRDRQRLRHRRGLRPPGPRARPAGRRARRAVDLRALAERARRGRAPRDECGLSDVGADRPAPEPARRRLRRRAVRRLAAHRHGAGGPPGRDPPAVRGVRRVLERRAGAGGGLVSARLIVVGDALLDRDLDGRAERLAPDAPVPVVDAIEARRRARRRRRWPRRSPRAPASRSRWSARSGDDAAGERAARPARRAPASTVHRPRPRRATPEKVRVRAGGRPLVRLDRGGDARACGPLTARRAPRSTAPTPCSSPTTAAASPPQPTRPRRARRAPRRAASCGTRTRAARRRCRGATLVTPERWPRPPRCRDPAAAVRRLAAGEAARARRSRALAARSRCASRCGARGALLVAGRRPAARDPARRARRRRPVRRGRLLRRRPPPRGSPPARCRPRRCARRSTRRRRSSPRAAPARVAPRRARRARPATPADALGRRRARPRRRRHRRRHRRLLRPAARRPRPHARGGARARRLPDRVPELRRVRARASRAPTARSSRRTTAPPCCAALACVDAVVVFDEDDPRAVARDACARTCGSRAATTPSPTCPRPRRSPTGAAAPCSCPTSRAAPPPD